MGSDKSGTLSRRINPSTDPRAIRVSIVAWLVDHARSHATMIDLTTFVDLILLHGNIKKDRRTRQEDIDKARDRLKEVLK